MNDYSNRLANVFHSHGYKHGDVVGLLQENRPEFVATWLGLSKLGVIVPLINHNLRKNALMHSVTVANCNALIYGEALADAVAEIADQLPSAVALYQVNEATQQPVLANAKDLTTLMQSASKELPVNGVKKPNHHDKLIYIYTSGTTGLPKAAVITHSRLVWRWRVVHTRRAGMYHFLHTSIPFAGTFLLRLQSPWWLDSVRTIRSTPRCRCTTPPVV